MEEALKPQERQKVPDGIRDKKVFFFIFREEGRHLTVGRNIFG